MAQDFGRLEAMQPWLQGNFPEAERRFVQMSRISPKEELMGKINYARVIFGGIVGGIVAATLDWFFNGVLIGQLWDDAMKSLNRPNALAGAAFLVVLYLLFIGGGILVVWMYAAIRPRFGAGVRTAVYAGLVAWAFSSLLSNLENVVNGLYDPRLMLYDTLFGLISVVTGAVIGAALYKEAESTPADYLAGRRGASDHALS